LKSIRSRLFLILIATTGLVWISAATWIYFGTRSKVEHVLDARLMEAARMVNSLIVDHAVDLSRAAKVGALAQAQGPMYEHQLSCQIWSLNGLLIGRSNSAPAKPLSQVNNGFSESLVNNETWRSFAVENKETGVRILVGDNISVRNRLIGDVMKGLIIPGLAIVPFLAVLIWLSIRQGLEPLRQIARELGHREASDLRPLALEGEAIELRPMIASLNSLFARVAAVLNREKNFTAFAAHELRTPLAGLKTHAQLARSVDDVSIRDVALSQIILGVDRTSRLVRQLLDMVTAGVSDPARTVGFTDAERVLRVIGDDLAFADGSHAKLDVDRSLSGITLPIDQNLFALAARNLVENALLHSPNGGTVRCHLLHEGDLLAVTIDDDGHGIPEDELPRVTERFFRGRHKGNVGSGLGLSIVDAALETATASLRISNRAEGGVRAQILIRAPRVAERALQS
jgi:two-component system sensor histidine kinase QseC